MPTNTQNDSLHFLQLCSTTNIHGLMSIGYTEKGAQVLSSRKISQRYALKSKRTKRDDSIYCENPWFKCQWDGDAYLWHH